MASFEGMRTPVPEEGPEAVKEKFELREVSKSAYPERMTHERMEQWADGIPAYDEADPKHPEWQQTPVVPIDLKHDGFGEVFVKNEADPSSNRTQTIKDRAAWELATLYRDYARSLALKMHHGEYTRGEIESKKIPRFTILTAGNEGRAVAEMFQKYDLPPPKILLGSDTPQERIEALAKLRADVYTANLSEKLTPDTIRTLTDNEGGVDITSVRSIQPESIFYDWQVHESFNEEPAEIYVPYGSGRLMENYLFWQAQTLRNDAKGRGRRDPRLRASVSNTISIDVHGAEPELLGSAADKLTARFKPFLLFEDQDINTLKSLEETGKDTGVSKVGEGRISQAYEILQSYGIDAEPSGAAGLALYLERYERGQVKEGDKVLVVNTGKGLL